MQFTYKDIVVTITDTTITMEDDKQEYVVYDDKYHTGKPLDLSTLTASLEIFYHTYFAYEE